MGGRGRMVDHTIIPEELSTEGAVRSELDKLDSWSEFNIFHLAELTGCRPLKYVAFNSLHKRGLLEKFHCFPKQTHAFLAKVEDMYMEGNNPYHNNIHGADVVQGVHSILCHTTFTERLTELEMFSVLLAAVGHDIAHPAVTNEF